MSLSKSVLDEYDRASVVLLNLPESVKAKIETFRKYCASWIKAYTGREVKPDGLSEEIAQLSSTHRDAIALLYKIARRFPAAKQVACDENLIQIAGILMRSEFVSGCHFINFRIDLPGEDQFLLAPHQEFPYIQGSLNGVTFWIPLMPFSPELGAPSWVAGSHKHGVLPVREYRLDEVGGSGGKSFQIDDTHLPPPNEFVQPEFSNDQMLAFSTLLLHRSEPNKSKSARLSLQVRFDDSMASESIDRNFPEGLYLGDKFSDSYPEYLLDE